MPDMPDMPEKILMPARAWPARPDRLARFLAVLGTQITA